MDDKNEILNQIIDDIAAGLTDDPSADYDYLRKLAKEYQTHEYADVIEREISKMMFAALPEAGRRELKEHPTDNPDPFAALLERSNQAIAEHDFEKALEYMQMMSADDLNENNYDAERVKTLQTLFPNYPEIRDCKLEIDFSIGNTKYSPTARLIIDQIEDFRKLIEKNHVSLYYSDQNAIKDNLKRIFDIISIAGKWKSFQIRINDHSVSLSTFFYFADELCKKYGIGSYGRRNPEEIRKEYKRASQPPRPKPQKREDSFIFDCTDCTPYDILKGIAMAYAEVYLSTNSVKTYILSEDEIVLQADNDLVVVFWLSPYGYGETVSGKPEKESTPYEFCTYVIHELTPNSLVKFNKSAFCRIFINFDSRSILFLKFNGIDSYVKPLNHFHKIDLALPELHLQERYNIWQGVPIHFVVLEMENAEKGKGLGIGYTEKSANDLLKKICKELESANMHSLDNNGVNGLCYQESHSFYKAVQSWQGETKKERLEKHLKFYIIEKNVKETTELSSLMKEILNNAAAGVYDSVERQTLSDIGRR